MKLKLKGKLTLYVTAIFLITYVVIVGYIIGKTQNKAIEDAKEIAGQYAIRNANDAKALLTRDLGVASAMAADIKKYLRSEESVQTDAVLKLLTGVVEEDDKYHSTWASIELNAINPAWGKNHGRKRYTVYRNKSNVIDSLNLDKDDIGSLYHQLKLSRKEEITDPYFFSEYSTVEQDEVFGTSVCVPLLVNGEFAGLVGMDLALNNFDFITQIKPYENASTFLIANNGAIVAHENKKLIGKNVSESFKATEQGLAESIQSGQFLSFNTSLNEEEVYVTFAPIQLGNSRLPWALGTIVPMDDMTRETDQIFLYSILLSIAGFLVLFFLTRLIAGKITQPIVFTSRLLKELSEGKIDQQHKLSVNRDDELGEMAVSLNTLIDSLEQKVRFATEIGENKLDSHIEDISKQDKLGIALQRMRDSLKTNNEQGELRNWFTQGVAEFSEILRYNNDDTDEFYFTIIQNLVKYLKANQGGIFLIREDEESERYLELMGAYAYDRRKFIEKKVEVGQGILGQCVLEADTVYLEEIPENYVRITSGLGDAPPTSILIVPLKLNNDVLGVVEIASFNRFAKHEIEFVEKVGENIASFIFSYNITVKTKSLLRQSQQKEEELKAAEEEMRQNIEELEATQEAMTRVHADSRRNEAILKALMAGSDDAVMVVDLEYTLVSMNEEAKKSFSTLLADISLGDRLSGQLSGKLSWKESLRKVFDGQKLSLTLEEEAISIRIAPVQDEKEGILFALVMLRKQKKTSLS